MDLMLGLPRGKIVAEKDALLRLATFSGALIWAAVLGQIGIPEAGKVVPLPGPSFGSKWERSSLTNERAFPFIGGIK